MIYRIISFSIKNKFIVGLMTLAIIVWGLYSMKTIHLGSVPDITNNQVQVMTISPNLSTEDIEQFVTYPVELEMGNLPGVEEIRSISRFGLSVITIVFEEEMGTYLPRQLVQERLEAVKGEIPEQFGVPEIGPITTGLGEVYQYAIEPEKGYENQYSITDLRTIQDWVIARQLTLIDGVVEVNAFGGNVKQYEVAINPEKLRAYDLTIIDVYEALEKNNANIGGAYIERNRMANFIRGEGLMHSIEDVEQTVVKTVNGIPLTIQDVAEDVRFGHQLRYGAFTKDGKEVVGGMVLMLKDASPKQVIDNIKERMAQIESSLPEGVKIVPFLDQSELIDRTTETVAHNLIEGALIVIFALVILLGTIRGGIITATIIPLSLLFAFILMKIFGISANLMSLGAIDFGIIVDGAVIIVEGTIFEIQRRLKKQSHQKLREDMDEIALHSSGAMMESAFFGQVIILLVFLPIVFLTGIEGKMFKPMAFTFGFTMLGAIILSLTYIPMMSSLLLKPAKNQKHWFTRLEAKLERVSHWIIGGLNRFYLPILKRALNFKGIILLVAVGIFALSLFTFSRMGGEFIPQLKEGDLAIQAMIRPGSSLEEMIDASKRTEKLLLKNFPDEILSTGSRIGVADIPTDPMPMDVSDMFVVLEKDKSKWTKAKDEGELIEKIEGVLEREMVGVKYVFSQPIELRFNELLTGVREDVAVKIYGEDLEVLNELAEQIEHIANAVPGAEDVNAERTSGLPQINIKYNRRQMAKYGVSIVELNTYINTAFAGGSAGIIYEGEKRFDLVVRYAENFRKSIDDIRRMHIALEDGSQIVLSELATIAYEPGPMQISRENTSRQTYVGVNVRGRDVKSVVHDIQDRIAKEVELAPGYRIEYGGEFENLESATERLTIVVPIALFMIFVLLFFALKSFVQAIMIYIAIPLGAIGGIYALWIRDMPFSISAGVGFIVLFGIAVLNGLVLINRFNSLKTEGVTDVTQRIIQGTKERLRPIFLTATTDIFGFIPMAFSSTAGAEVQRPLATVVIGGMFTATILTLIIIPILYMILENYNEKKQGGFSKVVPVMALLLLFVMPVFGQRNAQEISLEEAEIQALNRIPKLKAQRLEVDKQLALKKSVLDFGNTSVYTGKEEQGHGNDGVYTLFGIEHEGLNLFNLSAANKMQRQEVALAQSALDLTALEIRFEVRKAWADLYYEQNLLGIFQELDSLYQQLKTAAEIRYETGDISRLTYLATVNEANEWQLSKEQQEVEHFNALRRFNLWLVSDTLFTIENKAYQSFGSLVDLSKDSLENHPLLNYYEQEIRLAEAQLKNERSQALPSLFGGYGRQAIDGQRGFQKFELGISVPLVFNKELGRSQAAKIQQQIAQENRNQQRQELKMAVEIAKSDYHKWKSRWESYQGANLELAEMQRESAVLQFQEGDIDYATFIQTTRSAIQIEINAQEALRNYLLAYYQLTYYLN